MHWGTWLNTLSLVVLLSHRRDSAEEHSIDRLISILSASVWECERSWNEEVPPVSLSYVLLYVVYPVEKLKT